jgi:hypothetical protein
VFISANENAATTGYMRNKRVAKFVDSRREPIIDVGVGVGVF